MKDDCESGMSPSKIFLKKEESEKPNRGFFVCVVHTPQNHEMENVPHSQKPNRGFFCVCLIPPPKTTKWKCASQSKTKLWFFVNVPHTPPKPRNGKVKNQKNEILKMGRLKWLTFFCFFWIVRRKKIKKK